MIGQLIGGRYLVTGVLGEGGMGVVYVGEQRMGSTVRKVAIKTLHQDLAADPSLIERFHRECGTVVLLEHPHTIKFYDFGATEDGTLYIVMEFIAGKPLSEVIHEGPLPPARVVNILRQLCGALDEAHARGIIHRDLKPDNVILTQSSGEADFVKLLDFGIAARQVTAGEKQKKLTEPGTVLGTPEYMSPEQFSGQQLDARSDIYSLAVMSYEMLTGQLPFEAELPVEWAMHHLATPPTPFVVSAPDTHVPQAMGAAILRALSKNRDERPSNVKEFLQELSSAPERTVPGPAPVQPISAAARTRTVSMSALPDSQALPPSLGQRDLVERPPRRHRTALLIAAIALPLLAAAVFAAFSSWPDRERSRVDLVPPRAPAATLDLPKDRAAPVSAAESSQPAHISPEQRAEHKAAPAPSASASASPSPSPSASASASAASSSSSPGSRACDACLAAAEAGNLAEVPLKLALCTDRGRRAECLALSKKRARAASSALPPLQQPPPLGSDAGAEK